MALAVQSSSGSCGVEEVLSALQKSDAGSAPEKTLRSLSDAGWLQPLADVASVEFFHQKLREFLVARDLISVLQARPTILDDLWPRVDWHYALAMAASELPSRSRSGLVERLLSLNQRDATLLAGRIAIHCVEPLPNAAAIAAALTEVMAAAATEDPAPEERDGVENECLNLLGSMPGGDGLNALVAAMGDKRRDDYVAEKVVRATAARLVDGPFAGPAARYEATRAALSACISRQPKFRGPALTRSTEFVNTVIAGGPEPCDALGRAYADLLREALSVDDQDTATRLVQAGHVGAAADGAELDALLERVVLHARLPVQTRAYATKRCTYSANDQVGFERWRARALDERLDENIRSRNVLWANEFRFDHFTDLVAFLDEHASGLPSFVLYNLIFGTDLWPWRGNEAVVVRNVLPLAIRWFESGLRDHLHIALRVCRNLTLPRFAQLVLPDELEQLFSAARRTDSGYVRRQIQLLAMANGGSFAVDRWPAPAAMNPTLVDSDVEWEGDVVEGLRSQDILLRRQAALGVRHLSLDEHSEKWTAALADYESWVLDAAADSFASRDEDERERYLAAVERGAITLPPDMPFVPISKTTQIPSRLAFVLLERGVVRESWARRVISRCLTAPDPQERAWAAEALKFFSDPVLAAKWAFIASSDVSADVRAAAYYTLWVVRAPDFAKYLREKLTGAARDLSWLGRERVAFLLGALDFPAPHDICEALLEAAKTDTSYSVRCTAIASIGQCGPREAADALRHLPNDLSPGQKGTIRDWATFIHHSMLAVPHAGRVSISGLQQGPVPPPRLLEGTQPVGADSLQPVTFDLAGWDGHFVNGSQISRGAGICATKWNPWKWEGCFVDESTAILGTDVPMEPPVSTSAEWDLTLAVPPPHMIQIGFVMIACERVHGGMHTRRLGAKSRVLFNGHSRDLICLKEIPAGHTDYFHRPPCPPLPAAYPFSGCGTVYVWPIQVRHFASEGPQVIRVELEPDILWDIDYVGVIWREVGR